MVDRFGEPPSNVMALFSIALMRSIASASMICEISQKQDSLSFKVAESDLKAVSAVCAYPAYKGRIMFSALDAPYITYYLFGKDAGGSITALPILTTRCTESWIDCAEIQEYIREMALEGNIITEQDISLLLVSSAQ